MAQNPKRSRGAGQGHRRYGRSRPVGHGGGDGVTHTGENGSATTSSDGGGAGLGSAAGVAIGPLTGSGRTCTGALCGIGAGAGHDIVK